MRITIDLLKSVAHIYGIKIVHKKLPNGLLGEADAETKLITLDESLLDEPIQYRCVLAEEIGHILFPPRPGHVRCHSKSFYSGENCSSIKCVVAQDERKARDWATSVLLSNVDLCRIKKADVSSPEEAAACFSVEPWFMAHRIGYLRRKERRLSGRAKWRNIIRRKQR